jgi:hypothetical protein
MMLHYSRYCWSAQAQLAPVAPGLLLGMAMSAAGSPVAARASRAKLALALVRLGFKELCSTKRLRPMEDVQHARPACGLWPAMVFRAVASLAQELALRVRLACALARWAILARWCIKMGSPLVAALRCHAKVQGTSAHRGRARVRSATRVS